MSRHRRRARSAGERPAPDGPVDLAPGGSRRARQGFALPRELGTTAHLASAYPFAVEPGWGAEGVYLGDNLLAAGGGFFFDLFTAHAAGLITAPNMVISGAGGYGKSAVRKILLWRSAILAAAIGQRRWRAIFDFKGEWVDVAQRLGLEVVRLDRAAGLRVNPLDPGPAAARLTPAEQADLQGQVIAGMIGVVRDRPLGIEEESVVVGAVRLLREGRLVHPTVADALGVLRHRPAELASALGIGDHTLAELATPLALALDRLLGSELRGLVEADTTTGIDWATSAGMVFDLSGVLGDVRARNLQLLLAMNWVQQQMLAARDRLIETIVDEGYLCFDRVETARPLQTMWRLGRQFGCACTLICHSMEDFSSQVDLASAAGRMAEGLLNTTSVRVFLHQNHEQSHTLLTKMGLTVAEVSVLPRLDPHVALWKLGDHTALVRHPATGIEMAFIDTDTTIRRLAAST